MLRDQSLFAPYDDFYLAVLTKSGNLVHAADDCQDIRKRLKEAERRSAKQRPHPAFDRYRKGSKNE